MRREKKIRLFLMLLLWTCSLYFLFRIYVLQITPHNYFLILLASLLFVVVFITFWLIKGKRYFAHSIALLLSLLLVITSIQTDKVGNVIKKITGNNFEQHVLHVLVRKDDPYQTFDDIKEFTFGANTAFDEKNIEKVKKTILDEKQEHIHVKRYEDFKTLLDEFNHRTIDVLIINEAHYPLITEFDEHFKENTHIVESFIFKEELDPSIHDVDVSSDTFNVLIAGIDTDGPIETISQSDVNMLVTVNPKTHQILLTSIARDLHVVLHTPAKKDRLDQTGIFGTMETVKTVEDLIGVRIDYFFRLNFASFKDIIDALGGIEAYSHYNFSSGKYHFTQGINQMDGEKALRFVRVRKVFEEGEHTRNLHQQSVLDAVIKKSLSKEMIVNYSAFLESLSESFQTNIPKSKINTLIRDQISCMKPWEIIHTQITGDQIMVLDAYTAPGIQRGVKTPHYETIDKAKSLIDRMLHGMPISSIEAN